MSPPMAPMFLVESSQDYQALFTFFSVIAVNPAPLLLEQIPQSKVKISGLKFF